MSNYTKHYRTRNLPQSEQSREDQVQNSAGGFVFQITPWQRLDRFLVLGSEGGTYYVDEKKLTVDNAQVVKECIGLDGKRTVDRIVEISDGGRAPKNSPALFALAMCSASKDDAVRSYAMDALPRVARTGTHLFEFCEALQAFRGWGRAAKRGVANWYLDKDETALAYQVLKYRRREGWTHADVLRLSHPKPIREQQKDIFSWVVGKNNEPKNALVGGFLKLQNATSVREVVDLIVEFGFTREMVPTQYLKNVDVWRALLRKMPTTAMIRNLGVMSSIGLLGPFSQEEISVINRLKTEEVLRRSRIHPLSVLMASRVYENGSGVKGSLQWQPSAKIVDALDDAFYLSFGNVESTGKRIMLALDVSGSMSYPMSGTTVTCAEGAAAMALITANVEKDYVITAFKDKMELLSISPRQRLNDVLRKTRSVNFGRTDCAQPMLYAIENDIKTLDAFVVYTDNETWFGQVHPYEALRRYRRFSGRDAKLIVVGMTSTGFSIADPNDAGMLDVVGFDTATPQVISDFIMGNM